MAAKNLKPDGDSIDIRGIEDRSGFAFTDEAHRNRVATAAYYKSERRGFSPGAELDDWLTAEQEVGDAAAQDQQSR